MANRCRVARRTGLPCFHQIAFITPACQSKFKAKIHSLDISISDALTLSVQHCLMIILVIWDTPNRFVYFCNICSRRLNAYHWCSLAKLPTSLMARPSTVLISRPRAMWGASRVDNYVCWMTLADQCCRWQRTRNRVAWSVALVSLQVYKEPQIYS